jgi:hypothetical protein
MSAKQLKEDEFRDRFDSGESLESLGFDLDKGVLEDPQIKRVNVDFPDSVVAKLDRHAALMGITRQSLIKVWIFERLKEETAKNTIGGRMAPSILQAYVETMLKTGINTAEQGPHGVYLANPEYYTPGLEKKKR